MGERENRHRQSVNSITRKWTLWVGLCTSPLFILFAYLGAPARGRAAWVSAMMIALAARCLWDLRDRIWFWTTIAFVAVLHIPIILLVRWTDRSYSYMALLPVGLLDCGVAYGILRLVEGVIEKTSRTRDNRVS
jgi:hypothetical protein